MKTIYKYKLLPKRTTLNMPAGAQVLTVQYQGDDACLWALVDKDADAEVRSFDVYGTGWPIPDDPALVYVGTFQMMDGVLVFHVFDSTYATKASVTPI